MGSLSALPCHTRMCPPSSWFVGSGHLPGFGEFFLAGTRGCLCAIQSDKCGLQDSHAYQHLGASSGPFRASLSLVKEPRQSGYLQPSPIQSTIVLLHMCASCTTGYEADSSLRRVNIQKS